MASEMVERVALALARALHGTDSDAPVDLVDLARAAIEAMREPTEEMVDRGFDRLCRTASYDPPPSEPEGELKEIWQAMIAAAIALSSHSNEDARSG